jgi:hypothetical protein
VATGDLRLLAVLCREPDDIPIAFEGTYDDLDYVKVAAVQGARDLLDGPAGENIDEGVREMEILFDLTTIRVHME